MSNKSKKKKKKAIIEVACCSSGFHSKVDQAIQILNFFNSFPDFFVSNLENSSGALVLFMNIC